MASVAKSAFPSSAGFRISSSPAVAKTIQIEATATPTSVVRTTNHFRVRQSETNSRSKIGFRKNGTSVLLVPLGGEPLPALPPVGPGNLRTTAAPGGPRRRPP